MFDAAAKIDEILLAIEKADREITPQVKAIKEKLKSAKDAEKEALEAEIQALDRKLMLAGKNVIDSNFENFKELRSAAIEKAAQHGVPAPSDNSIILNERLIGIKTMKVQLIANLYGFISSIYKAGKEKKRKDILKEAADVQRGKFDQIIAKINEGNHSVIYECMDFIAEGIFEPASSKKRDKDGCAELSHTFLSYAITRLEPKMLKALLLHLKRTLGDDAFQLFLETPINPDRKIATTTLQAWFLTEYREERSSAENAKHNQRQAVLLEILNINYNNVDTHTAAVNMSANISHTTAFRRMVEIAEEKMPSSVVNATYSNNDSLCKKPNRVDITYTNEIFDLFINLQLLNLRTKLVATSKLSDQEIYESMLGASFLDKFDDQNKTHTKKVAYCRFQIDAALRFMDEMVTHHTCGEHPNSMYPYKTNDREFMACGLTIEEIVASIYCLWTHDKPNFLNQKIDTALPLEQQKQQEIDIERNNKNIYQIVYALHNIRRGYDIEEGRENPDHFIFPQNCTADTNRCQDGATNGLVDALNGIHKLYLKNVSTIDTLKSDIKKLYNEILESKLGVIKENLHAITQAEFAAWLFANKTPSLVQDIVRKAFENEHRKKFNKTYGAYFPASNITPLLEEYLARIAMPDSIKTECSIQIDAKMILEAMENKTLPLVIYDRDSGHKLTLEHYCSIVPNLTQYILASGSIDYRLQLERINKESPARHFSIKEYNLFVQDQSPLTGRLLSRHLRPINDAQDIKEIQKVGVLIRECFKEINDFLIGETIDSIIPQWHLLLEAAVVLQDIEMVEILLSKDFAADIINHNSIINASMYDFAIFKCICDTKTGKIVIQNNITAISSLMLAEIYGNIDTVKYLLDSANLDIDDTTLPADTHPLVIAIQFRRFDILKEIAQNKKGLELLFKNITITNEDQATSTKISAIEFLITSKNLEALRILLPHSSYKQKIQALAKTKFGRSIIMTAGTFSVCGALYASLSSETFLQYASTALEVSSADLLFNTQVWLACICIMIPIEWLILDRIDKNYHEKYSASEMFL